MGSIYEITTTVTIFINNNLILLLGLKFVDLMYLPKSMKKVAINSFPLINNLGITKLKCVIAIEITIIIPPP